MFYASLTVTHSSLNDSKCIDSTVCSKYYPFKDANSDCYSLVTNKIQTVESFKNFIYFRFILFAEAKAFYKVQILIKLRLYRGFSFLLCK